jgi:hypothetical protein
MIEPYSFTAAYADCYSRPRGAMDRRHVFVIHEILRSRKFSSTLELGSYNGASATAFIEAINAGAKMSAAFCDIEITDSLRRVINNVREKQGIYQLKITSQDSWDVLASEEHFDFILVDANHDMRSVCMELPHLLRRRPLCVMAHDTNATAAGYREAEGAKFLADTFRGLPGYYCLEDCKSRDGEETQRGLFFAAADKELFEVGKAAFAKYCND